MKNYSAKRRENQIAVFAGSLLMYFVIFAAGLYILTENLFLSCVIAAPASPFSAYSLTKSQVEKRRIKTERQFAELMQLVLTSVCAGKSAELAIQEILDEAEAERRHPFGMIKDSLRGVLKRSSMNFNFYDEFVDFAVETGSGDIISTAFAMKIVGVKGGNLPYILRNSLAGLRVKTETDSEIRQTLALPKYNHRIITCLPFAMVLMVKELSEEYADVLYNTRAGIAVVLCASGVILLSWILGDRFCKIDI